MTPGAAPSAASAGLGRERLLELYYYLRLTRSLEERLVSLHRQGRVIGGVFRSLGQEGESVASAYALEPGDVLSPLIRNLGALLVRGAAPADVLRQYLAKGTGPSRGRDLNIHFNDLERGYLGQISHLGDMLPVMAGIALSFKLRGERRVGLVYAGDGATSTGTFHEGLNFAAVQRLPLVVLVEHNGYAFSTPTSAQTAVPRLAVKAKAYGIPGVTVDGNDVPAVYQASRAAVERARAGGGVTLLEVVTYRRKGHAEHDDQRYQPKAEIEAWEARDPIARFAELLRRDGTADAAMLAAIDHRVTDLLDRAVTGCENDPLPEPESALTGVLVSPPSAERLWFRT